MEWTVALIIIWIIVLVFRRRLMNKVEGDLTTRRQTIWNIAYKLKVAPDLVQNMLDKIGSEKASYFIDQVKDDDNLALDDAVYIFFIFQILQNNHPQNVVWWMSKMKEAGYSPRLNLRIVDVAFSYFKRLNVENISADQFTEIYNNQYCSTVT